MCVCMRVCMWPLPLIHFTFHFLSRLSTDPRHLDRILSQFLPSTTSSSFLSLLLFLIANNSFPLVNPFIKVNLIPSSSFVVCLLLLSTKTFSNYGILRSISSSQCISSPFLGKWMYSIQQMWHECENIFIPLWKFFLISPSRRRPDSDEEQQSSWYWLCVLFQTSIFDQHFSCLAVETGENNSTLS